MKKYTFWVSLLLAVLEANVLLAQDLHRQKLPLEVQKELGQGIQNLKPQHLPKFQLNKVLAEDQVHPGTRFAAPLAADFSLEKSGTWERMKNGDAIWRLKINSPDALGLVIFYDNFFLPSGAQLRVYNADGSQMLGPFTSFDNRPSGNFLTGLVLGESAVLEYYEPNEVLGEGRFHIGRVDHAYNQSNLDASGFQEAELASVGFGMSSPCNININCPDGAPYTTEKRAVCRIFLVVEEGTGYCTGSLINNTKNDGRPLIISAFHCQDFYTPLYDLWRFDFNYETPGCTNPDSEPAYQSILGCKLLSGRQANDFLLMELNSRVPSNFNAYFLGWNRQTTIARNGAIIHHPRGDIKKVSTTSTAISTLNITLNWNNQVTSPPGSHVSADLDVGIFQTGSSGSPLLDQDKLFIGQLHGGIIPKLTCDSIAVARFGRLTVSWNAGNTPDTRLSDWLDPLGNGATTLNGIENPILSGGKIGGTIQTENNIAVPNARVSLLGKNGLALSTTTDSQGKYIFDNIPFGDSYEISVTKEGAAVNGITTFDLIKIQKHILNLELLSLLKQYAGDVNKSRSLSTLDMILIRRILLGIDTDFTDVTPWYFLPTQGTFNVPNDPFSGITSGANVISSFTANVLNFDFYAIKYGDVNNSVDVTK